jgi:DNA-binding NarL/FixJ family response regulator
VQPIHGYRERRSPRNGRRQPHPVPTQDWADLPTQRGDPSSRPARYAPTPAAIAGPVAEQRGCGPIVIIDDHQMFSTTLSHLLRSHELDARHVATAAGTATILAQLVRLPAGLALLDLHLGVDLKGRHIDSIDLVGPLRERGWAVLAVVDTRDETRIAAAIAAGAIGTVSMSDTFETLLSTVRAAAEGEQPMTDEARHGWEQRHRDHEARQHQITQRIERLSNRERQVLDLLAQGHHAGAITTHFAVSITTVRAQIRSALAKLEVNSQLEAVALLSRAAATPGSGRDRKVS